MRIYLYRLLWKLELDLKVYKWNEQEHDHNLLSLLHKGSPLFLK